MNIKALKYWQSKAKLIEWFKKPEKVFSKKKNNFFEWYEGGKVNVAYNCIQKNINLGLGNKIAIYTCDKENNFLSYTYTDLSILIDKFCIKILENLKNKNKNTTIMIHASASIESAVAMFACANLGIHFSVVFEDLPKKAILLRIKLLKPELIITRSRLDSVKKKFNNLKKKILIFSNEKIIDKNINHISIEKLKKNTISKKKFNFYNSSHTLFTLFTSGSTGEPKGIQHSSAGYLIYSKLTCIEKFGMKKSSVVLTASDAGWINGHTYALFGPLSIGATTVLVESPMMLLNEKILKKIINKIKITIIYLPVTLVKLIRSVSKEDFSSKYIKTVGSMGEPLSPSVNKWLSKAFTKKKVSIINTYFQTETGGIIFSPSFKDVYKEKDLGSVGTPVCKHIGLIKSNSQNKFEIILNNPWPGCMINVVNGIKTWKKYWHKSYFKMFDIGSYKDNKLFIHGRNDDVINIRGHRLGSEELESVVMQLKGVVEASCVSINDKLEGSKMVIFITINIRNSNNEQIRKLLIKKISEHFGSFALPKDIIFLRNLPRTRSGKILRRLLRDLYQNSKIKISQLNDLSTMINSEQIPEIINKINEQKR